MMLRFFSMALPALAALALSAPAAQARAAAPSVPNLQVLGQVAQAQPVQARASGQVVRITPTAGKIAIRHGAIPKLELPAMTLVYHLDVVLLDGIVVGDIVEFTAQRANQQYRIIALKKK
ncbi:copper-binding protein [Castellaniella hirudinis]|uniref:copper-binding protein n=1 Tax=Castellaniella hirudinis TaxID=1144617 RepID=UPI0039C331DB